ncbi:MAG TPA: VOC family protein [Flavipsychrobacter sp.]
MKQQLTPCLWFDNQAKAAAELYCQYFADTKVISQSPIVTEISISGQKLVLLDGGPKYKPTPAISFFYIFDTADELQRAWDAFAKEGTVLMPLDKYDWSEQYGWVNDKFGISWQLSLGKLADVGQRVTPTLMFAGKQYGRAEEAINHYSNIFKNAALDGILRYGSNEAPDVEGKVKHAQLGLNGYKMMLMDSAQHNFGFTEGVSLTIHCETQQEIDYYWQRLTENGAESMCGWLTDKFGVSWQVIPNVLEQLMSDPAKAGKAAQAFMQMRKLDIVQIVQATL